MMGIAPKTSPDCVANPMTTGNMLVNNSVLILIENKNRYNQFQFCKSFCEAGLSRPKISLNLPLPSERPLANFSKFYLARQRDYRPLCVNFGFTRRYCALHGGADTSPHVNVIGCSYIDFTTQSICIIIIKHCIHQHIGVSTNISNSNIDNNCNFNTVYNQVC